MQMMGNHQDTEKRSTQIKRYLMKSGFESLTWLNDKNGKEYVCHFIEDDHKSYEELNEEEKRKCADVNTIVGTERW